MREFIFQIAAVRVVFGAGRRSCLAEEIERLGARRVLIITDPSHAGTAREIGKVLGQNCVGVYDQVAPHVPMQTAEAGRAEAARLAADCCLTIGGGSSTGLGKAIALTNSLPLVALPTTYAGSEMTPIWGLTEGQQKRTGRDPRVQPRLVVYDPELALSLPPKVAGPSGMNAMAHCVEALYASNANPVMSLLAEEGARALARALPEVVRDPQNLDAQSEALYGAWLAGTVLGAVGMGLHHKLCHILGGTFNTPHAETHAVVLPYVAAFNMEAVPDARQRLERALGTAKYASALRALGQRALAPPSLRDLGLSEADLDRVAELAAQSQYDNPRSVSRDEARRLLQDAYLGETPHP